MEVKKSHKADLEHRRPYVFAAAIVGITLFLVGVLFIPFHRISEWGESFFDDYSMDLDLNVKEKDDMIAAALPEQPEEKKEPEKINKVDETTELAPEQLENTDQQKDDEAEEKEEEETPPINMNDDDDDIQSIVEELPEYPGGMVEFVKWLTATLKYPDAALKQHVEGKVMLSFIVNKDGTLSDIKVMQSAHKLLDEEALRVAGMMPNWKPGKDKGRPCRTKVAIPVVFEI